MFCLCCRFDAKGKDIVLGEFDEFKNAVSMQHTFSCVQHMQQYSSVCMHGPYNAACRMGLTVNSSSTQMGQHCSSDASVLLVWREDGVRQC
jgi:hypothetical protein